MLWPTTDWLCAVQAGQIHAAPTGPVLANRRRCTVDTVCSLHRVRLYTVATRCSVTGDDLGLMVLPWPPPRRHDGCDRCRRCWERTGRKRPAAAFRELRYPAVDRPEGEQ